jgi:hypothetical protein
MKILPSFLGVALFLVGAAAALGDGACQQCTRDLQVKYRACRQSGKDQATCRQEQRAAVHACVTTCQNGKAPDERP